MNARQESIARILLTYLLNKKTEATFTDDYYLYLQSKGISDIEIEQIITHLIHNGYINYLGKDQYWIQLTSSGKTYCLRRKTKKYNLKETIELIAALAGIIGTLIAIISWLC